MQAQMNEALAKDQLVSELVLKQSQVDAEQLGVRNEIAKEQLASKADSMRAQLAVQQSLVDQARALLQLTQQQRDELKVRAGLDGMLQLVPVEVGQQVAPGHEPRARRQPEPAEGRDQDRGDAGQGHPDRPEGRGRHAQRHRRRPRRPHRSVGAERHAHGRRLARPASCRRARCPT